MKRGVQHSEPTHEKKMKYMTKTIKDRIGDSWNEVIRKNI